MEEENPRGVSRRNSNGTPWKSNRTTSHHRNHHDGEPKIKCSGNNCRSWAANLIADCVALCCCPCAVVNLLTLAFVKVPWMVGRKCLGRKRKRRRKRKNENDGGGGDGDDYRFVVERDGSLTKEEFNTASFGLEMDAISFKEGMMADGTASFRLDEEIEGRISARVEAEKVWLELYQIGHLGFGRVSFTGIQ